MATSTRFVRLPSPTSSGTTSEPDHSLQRTGASPDGPRHAGPPAGPPRANRGPLPPPRRAVATVRVARSRDGLVGVAGGNARGDRSGRRAAAALADRGGGSCRRRPAAHRAGRRSRRQRASADRGQIARAWPRGTGPRARRRRPDRAIRRARRCVEPRRLPVRVRSASGRRLPCDAPASAGVSETQGARRRSISSR